MAEFKVLESTDALYDAIKQKRSEGYSDYELSVISKKKLHLDDLHDSEINLTATTGGISDVAAKLLTGEDTEAAVLNHYNMPEDKMDHYKDELHEGKYILVTSKDESTHNEVENCNAAYTTDGNNDNDSKIVGNHYSEQSEGPKS
ncbi:general stress protein [Staphylococcus durrellii]|uniref:general stress protein n=1 Tax=Staphylococcus durrellii TaxID=2781773 RepID=UPI00189C710A|nr:general stress protein [Staphylococcus durrellii]MBF7017959.1 general stress protein [Staphylococcus durrellii]